MKRNSMLYLSVLTLLVLGGLLLAWDARGAAAQELETWTAVAPLPVPMGGGLVRCPDDPDSFYIVSGIMRKNANAKWLFQYDISADSWERLKGMPEALRGTAAACYEGKIYVAGGTNLRSISNALYIYDIATNTWSSGPTLPNPVAAAWLGSWEGKLYLVGGSSDLANPVDQVDVYDIASGVWTADGGARMPTAAFGFAHAQAGQFFYAVGGATATGNIDQTQRYDMSANTWMVGPTFASRRAYSGLAVTSTHLYALGGDIEDGEWTFHATDLVEVLDLSAWPDGEWVDSGIPLPAPNLYPPTTCTETLFGGEIWDVGGGSSAVDNYTDVYYLPIGEGCP